MRQQRTEAGITLVELLIAMALTLILIGPLLSFLRAAQVSRSAAIRLTDIEQNARAAMLAISRDIQNAGYNFAPRVNLGASAIMRPLVVPSGVTELTPIIPGNNVNLIRGANWAPSSPVMSRTDQITLVSVSQSFNNGLPLSGTLTINNSASRFTYNSDATFNNLYVGDFVLLSSGQIFAIGVVTAISGNQIVLDNNATNDPYGINQAPAGPISLLDPIPQTGVNISLYKFSLITYFVDEFGNLIRREQLTPPHTTRGGNSAMTAAAFPSADSREYNCGAPLTCYYDNIIAIGIEDLQFRYYVADPSATGLSGFINDPGYYGSTAAGVSAALANRGAAPNFRLLDIRQVNVLIKTRAADRDTRLRDPYNRNAGYIYRFSLEGTFNTRNFYGADYRPV
ncbi:MAG: prepilin-type N-terminal cleavage/methylation domain-containing protein [Acidobacteriota bacterium]